MKKLAGIVLLLSLHPAVGQTVHPRIAATLEAVEQFYHAGQYDSIFHRFSPSMQQHLPKEETHNFFAKLNFEAGRILEKDAVKALPTRVTYKTYFEKGVFALDIALDQEGGISGFAIKPFGIDDLPVLERNISPLVLPFKGRWKVLWGGETRELNYHVENQAQKNAFDFFVLGESGRTYRASGQSNEDYYAFGQEIIAPCNAEVVLVVDGIKDNVPGEMNPAFVFGNTVILKSSHNEYFVLAHFKQHSIEVKQGEKVKQGQLLGLCGNSGNSSEPHLHFHLQNVEEIFKATGAKVYFDEILVDGKIKTDYSPVRGEVLEAGDK